MGSADRRETVEKRRRALKRARKPRSRRSREPSEKAAGQAAAIVDHDPRGELASDAGLIRNHVIFYHSGRRRDNQSMAR
jgi:hypothetical protein